MNSSNQQEVQIQPPRTEQASHLPPEVPLFSYLDKYSYKTSHLRYKSEGTFSLISNRLSNTVNSTSYTPWLVVGVCPLTSQSFLCTFSSDVSHTGTTLRTDSLPSTWEH